MVRDLLDCLDEYRGKIGPLNAPDLCVGIATQFGLTDPSTIRSVFKRLGNCHDITLNPEHLELLDQYYLVWYKDDNKGQNGPQFADSYNYRLSDFRNEFLSGSSNMMKMVNSNNIIDNLKNGLTESITLITIKDTTLNKALLLDGTKRFLALQYIESK